MAYDVYFVRHGQTLFNKYNKMQGWCDSPLTDQGVLTAKMTGEFLKNIEFDHVFSSDMSRTVQTGHLVLSQNKKCKNLKIKKLMNFREQSYGYFEGTDSLQAWFEIGAGYGCTRLRHFIQKYSFAKAQDVIKEKDPFHDAENSVEFWQRLNAGLDVIQNIAKPNGKILVISHGMTIRCLVQHYNPSIDVMSSPFNGSVTKLHYENEIPEIEYYNKRTDNLN